MATFVAFKINATEFYVTHRDLVAETMNISTSTADDYVRRAHAAIMNSGDVAIIYIEETGAQYLADLALKEKR
jgi:hypothetical protein